MKLISCNKNTLNRFGLIDSSWIIQDPENTRYITNNAKHDTIVYDDRTVGFMVSRRSGDNELQIDYLLFDPTSITNKLIDVFYRKHLAYKAIKITTYDVGFVPSVWQKAGFKIKYGHQYMQCPTTHLYLISPHSFEIQNLAWPKDYKKIVSVYRECFPESEWSFLDDFRTDYYANTANVFLVKNKSSVVGFWIDATFVKDECFICWIGVVPEMRRKGVATQILRYGAELAVNRGCHTVSLLVQPTNETAVNFYRKCGFQKMWQRIHLSRT